MIKIGLIGGSGCGKSLIADYLTTLGLLHIDCDIVAREVVEPGSACLAELVSHFGQDILHCDGSLNRKALASLAFSSPEQTKMLNQITHKYILERTDQYINNSSAKGVVVDAAALAESGYLDTCDYVIAVVCPYWKRLFRIMRRDQLSYKDAKQRIMAQKSDGFYHSYADYIIRNNRNFKHLKKQIHYIYNKIFK